MGRATPPFRWRRSTTISRPSLLEFHPRGDLDCPLEASGYRTPVHVHFQHPGHRIAHLIRVRHAQLVIHMDPPNDEDAVLLLDLANHLCDEILGLDLYLARTQRAGKCAR